jgi:uncharacterized membrane protein YdfJ with MMPL/SSD domain
MKRIAFWLVLALFALPVAAQSLTDLSEKGKADREKNKPAKVYTNNDLKSAKGSIATSTLPQPKKAEGEAGAEGEAAKKPDIDKEYKDKLVAKYRELQDLQRQRDVAYLELNQAKNDYFRNSSGVEQNQIYKPRWDAATKQLSDAEQALTKGKNELQALKDEARRKGVPAGVVREAEKEGMSQAPPAESGQSGETK